MDPSYAAKLLAFNKHTSDPQVYPNPFEDLNGLRDALTMRVPRETSVMRAKIAAMNHDIISAALWSLSGFDPALVHLAEFREHLAHLNEEDPRRHTLDRLISVYVEGQCRELLIGAGITTQEADQMTMERIPDPAPTVFQILACTDHPLAIELMGYALRLGSITAHGQAPWNRFKAVMADCFAQQRQPTSA